MRQYKVKIVGTTPLLMHHDNIEWADKMADWKNDPSTKKGGKSVAGDDRSPAFRWLGSLYHDGKHVAIPSDNLMRCLMEGGAMVPVPGGRSGKTFKSQTQSGCIVGEPYWPLSVEGHLIDVKPLLALTSEDSFDAHQKAAAESDFMLFVKRARVGPSKHIRVRPRFDRWSSEGTISVFDDQITKEILESILRLAGQYKGLGDWRPGGKTPGPWGMFEASVS